MRKPTVMMLVPLSWALLSCAGANAEHGGQSPLVDRTFAGQNKCSTSANNRPFVIEWDATDQSSFQARAADDIVVVKYEGCSLHLLDACTVDGLKGSLGSYKPAQWTSGQLESVDISDEDDLYAKLPLGTADLGGRVARGERFHMEYYVSGTRSGTREHLYRSTLAKIPGCAGATHFVHAYNLGAFALASTTQLKGQVNGSYFGFGAGASHASSSQADKKGGDLSSCRSESAKETESCKVPIRLTLREISEGDDPEAAASLAPETDASANLAGQMRGQLDREREAGQHMVAAVEAMNARDGKRCLDELDKHDRLDPRPEGMSAGTLNRAKCVMLTGRCEAGRALAKKSRELENMPPDRLDAMVDGLVGEYCEGADLSPRDLIQRARIQLAKGGYSANGITSDTCKQAYEVLQRANAITGDTESADPMKIAAMELVQSVPRCFARAGDCAAARAAAVALHVTTFPGSEDQALQNFSILVPQCKGK